MAPRYNKNQIAAIEGSLGLGFPKGSGVSPGVRAKVSFARTKEGGMNILAESGYNPVDLSRYGFEGELGVFQDGRVWRVDPEDFEMGDILDLAGDVPPALLSTVGGIGAGVLTAPTGPGAVAAGLAGSAAGGVAGEGISQGLAALFGAEEGVQPGRMALEAAMAPVGEVGGRVITAGAKRALAPFGGAVTKRVSKIPERAREFDEAYGTDVAGKLPASAQTESRTLGAIEQRVAETPGTVDPYIEQQRRPYQQQVENLLTKIGQQRVGGPSAGKEEVGEALTQAAEATKEQRQEVVGQMYDRVRDLVAPNTPVIPEETIRVVEQINTIVNRGRPTSLNKPARDTVDNLLEDVTNIRTFEDLDSFRQSVGAQVGTAEGRKVFQQRGLDAQISRLYAALRNDVDQFYEGGALVTEAAKDRTITEAAEAAEEAAAAAARSEETISVSKAIANLGGMDVSGLAAEEMPGKVGRRLRSLATQATNQKRPLKGADLMAERLREEYPELGIETLNDLREVLRREDRFFDNVPTGATSNIQMEFAARPVTGEETLGFDVPALEKTIEDAASMDDLSRAFGGIETALEAGEISQFQRDRLRNMANNMAAALGDPGAKAQAGELATEFGQFEQRAGRLGEEVAEQGAIAKGVYKELADLDSKKALQLFKNEDKAASIVDRMAKMEAAEIRTIKQKIGAMPVESMQKMQVGTLPEGEQAWRLAQRSVFDMIAGKGTIDRTERMTNDMIVRSGERMLTMLDKFKEGSLEELLGKDAAQELYGFAELISDANLAARFNENFSRTAGANWLYDLVAGLRNGFARGILYAIGKIGFANKMLKAVATPGGKRWVTEGVAEGPLPGGWLAKLGVSAARGAASPAGGRIASQIGVRQGGGAAINSLLPQTFQAQPESTRR